MTVFVINRIDICVTLHDARRFGRQAAGMDWRFARDARRNTAVTCDDRGVTPPWFVFRAEKGSEP
jgi:hypothetical protein